VRTAQRGASTDAIRPLCDSLHAYGRALEDTADWALALDAYHVGCRVAALLADPVRRRHDASLVLRMGTVHRNMGSLRDAATMYARARELARSVSWREGELGADRGEAKLLITRGALPEAQQRLEHNASQAAADGLPAVQALTLHDLGMVLGMRGQLGEAIKRLFDAYRLTPSESVADRWDVLADIAYAFSLVGLHETARDVFRVIARRGSRRHLRWVAATSLIELAVVAGDVPEFEYWRDWVGGQRMSPELRTQYFLDVGRGKLAFGQVHEAVQTLELALGIAEEFGYGQFIFMTEAALATARQRLLRPGARLSMDESDRDAEAIAEIGELLRAELAMA
jgi:tetratricopeptide (TPR) repeat protein